MNIINQHIKYIYYKDIYLNHIFIYKLLFFYRIIISLIALCYFINQNPVIILQLINIFEIYYFNELIDDIYNKKWNYLFIYHKNINNLSNLNINPWNISNSYIGSTFTNYSSGFSTSSREPGGGDSVGIESTIENENSRKRKNNTSIATIEPKIKDNPVEFKYVKKRKLFHDGPDFCLKRKIPDRNKWKWFYPECGHVVKPEIMASKTMRVYNDDGIRYTYLCHHYSMRDRFCKITYPDGTTLIMNKKSRIWDHILFHRKHIYFGNCMEPYYNYSAKYVEHFNQYRKKKLYTQPIDRSDMLKISNILNN